MWIDFQNSPIPVADPRGDHENFFSTTEMPVTLSAVCALNFCPLPVYPNVRVYSLLQLLATLPVSTAHPERMFSKVDSTLTQIRSTMSEDGLEALVLMQTHRNRVTELAINDIIDKFAACRPLKLNF